MDEQIEAFGTALAGAAIARDGAGVHAMLAPWLQAQLPSLREKPSWKPESRPIPADVTEGNFRQWMTIQLQTSDEDQQALGLDYLTELWLIVVETGQGLRVGYWNHDAH